MGRLFGTDGIRRHCQPGSFHPPGGGGRHGPGRGHPGRAPRKRPTVVIGRDTRLSGEMLQAGPLAGGLMAGGADVVLLGGGSYPGGGLPDRAEKRPRPAWSFRPPTTPTSSTASRSLARRAAKPTDDEEDEIERMLLDRDIPMIPVEPEEIGTCREDREAAVQYAGYLASTVPEKLTGIKVLVDCSNGAAVRTAEELFSLLGAEVTILCDAPMGPTSTGSAAAPMWSTWPA